MAKPVATEIRSVETTAIVRRNFFNGSSMGLPAKKIVCVSGKSAAWLWRSTRNAANRIRNVSPANTAKVPHSRPKLFQKTLA